MVRLRSKVVSRKKQENEKSKEGEKDTDCGNENARLRAKITVGFLPLWWKRGKKLT